MTREERLANSKLNVIVEWDSGREVGASVPVEATEECQHDACEG